MDAQKFYLRDDQYSVSECCSLQQKDFVKGDLTFYGIGAGLDMLIKERAEAENGEFRALLESSRQEWRAAFFEEMYKLLGLEQNP